VSACDLRPHAVETLAATALEHLDDGVLVLEDDAVVMANRAACRMLGRDRDELVGRPAPGWVSPRSGRALHASSIPIPLADGTTGSVVTLRDRSAETAREAELVRLAQRDGLTGLLNQRSFTHRLAEQVARLSAAGRPLGLVVLDLDHFKAVNDEHGHPVGDRVLAEAAARLAAVARAVDSVGRTGGEEFAWVLPDASEGEILVAAERLRRRIAQEPFAGGLRLTASIGFCDLTAGTTPEELVQRADQALYWAKSLGRDAALGWSATTARRLARAAAGDGAARTDVLAALRAVADEADPTPGGAHGARVADLAAALAAQLDCSPDRQARLHLAARLHDLGKAVFPDALLRRHGPLSVSEKAHLDRHATIGAELAGAVLDAEQAAWIARHHDRWDGGGDPMPAGAALVALADAWDAMTHDRPYRPALAPQAALAEIDRCAGAQFLPEAGDLLRRALRWWSAA
jgi:two-component system cell cycle response regulator